MPLAIFGCENEQWQIVHITLNILWSGTVDHYNLFSAFEII